MEEKEQSLASYLKQQHEINKACFESKQSTTDIEDLQKPSRNREISGSERNPVTVTSSLGIPSSSSSRTSLLSSVDRTEYSVFCSHDK